MSALIETICSSDTDNRIMTVAVGPVTVEVQLDPDYMGFQIPDPVYLGASEARLLADALVRAADLLSERAS